MHGGSDRPFRTVPFPYYLAEVGYDVHWLDGDNDGVACESLPLGGSWIGRKWWSV
ncbi:MAG: excalibur calcium-binding domain-containing protein [Caldilineaceae bacterium]|nr:excalibur calcium-binding domain-containing protein [Caldilineaceae bacterium]